MNSLRKSAISRTTTSPRQGFSLIEVMIGMFILGLVLLSCLIALPEMRELTYRSDSMRLAFAQLNAEIEGQRTRTFDQMAEDINDSATTTTTQSDNGGLLGTLLGGGATTTTTTGDAVHHTSKSVTQNDFTYAVDTYHHFIDDEDEVIEAIVVVNWTFAGRDQTITGKAIFTKDGLSDKKFSPIN